MSKEKVGVMPENLEDNSSSQEEGSQETFVNLLNEDPNFTFDGEMNVNPQEQGNREIEINILEDSANSIFNRGINLNSQEQENRETEINTFEDDVNSTSNNSSPQSQRKQSIILEIKEEQQQPTSNANSVATSWKNRGETSIYYFSIFLRYLSPFVNLVSLILLIIDHSHTYIVASAVLSVVALGIANLGDMVRSRYISHYKDQSRKPHIVYADHVLNNIDKVLKIANGDIVDLKNYAKANNLGTAKDIDNLLDKTRIVAKSKWLAFGESILIVLRVIDNVFLCTSLYFKALNNDLNAIIFGSINTFLNGTIALADDVMFHVTENMIQKDTITNKRKDELLGNIILQLSETDVHFKEALDEIVKVPAPLATKASFEPDLSDTIYYTAREMPTPRPPSARNGGITSFREMVTARNSAREEMAH